VKQKSPTIRHGISLSLIPCGGPEIKGTKRLHLAIVSFTFANCSNKPLSPTDMGQDVCLGEVAGEIAIFR